MTQPRRIVAGQSYMLTRRTILRTFLMRPDPIVTAAFEYCLANAAKKAGIQLIAWVAMSNHYHAVVHDRHAQLPVFLEHFHKLLAKTLNAYLRRRENFWSAEETCVTQLVTLDDVFDKVVYVLTNPVSAHLVDDVAQWPGASSWSLMGESSKEVTRPKFYFREDGVMPPTATLEAVVPPGLVGESADEWIKRVRQAVALKELSLREKRREKETAVLGQTAVLATEPFDTPKVPAERSKLRPALACQDPEQMKEARSILKGFRTAYRRSFRELCADTKKRFLEGKHRLEEAPAIVFPPGTYRLRLVFEVPCEGLPAAAAA